MACLFSITFQHGTPSNFVFVLFLFFCLVLFLFCFVLFCFCPERRGWGGRHSTIAWTLQSLKAKKCLV